ncbi:DUF2975 domain-containing protein [Undibacterium sp. TJN19]|uniref:DUF2975 domain-containing protein n=1 Tax=Undibacterium sp. TJN19 TaxID=3413055 RepID=UPI003BF34623
MTTPTQCRLIRILLLLCFLTQVLFFILAWTSTLPSLGTWLMRVVAKGLSQQEMQNLSSAERWLGVLTGLPVIISMAIGLWNLDRLLARLNQATMFSLQSIGRLRTFAGAISLSTVLSIIEPPVRTAAYLLLPGEHTGKFSVSVSTEELVLLLVCTVFYLVIGIMHEGRRLAEENEAFI